jgi:hypothetical protein
MSSWVEDFEKEHLKALNKQFDKLIQLYSRDKQFEIMEEIEQKIKETKEDIIIAYIEANNPVTFQDLMERFKVNELYAKTVLTRVNKKK